MSKTCLLLAMCVVAMLGCDSKPKTKSQPATAKPVAVDPWPAGSVFVSRNKLESDNSTPASYWNHLSVYVGHGVLVESQMDRGVIYTSIQDWMNRDYIWFPLYPIDVQTGDKAAARAVSLVGLPYRELSSLIGTSDRFEAAGLNCVSVARLSYEYALNRRLVTLHVPDDAEKLTDVFTKRDPRFTR